MASGRRSQHLKGTPGRLLPARDSRLNRLSGSPRLRIEDPRVRDEKCSTSRHDPPLCDRRRPQKAAGCRTQKKREIGRMNNSESQGLLPARYKLGETVSASPFVEENSERNYYAPHRYTDSGLAFCATLRCTGKRSHARGSGPDIRRGQAVDK